MIDDRASDCDILVLHYRSAIVHFVCMHEGSERYPPLVRDARVDIICVHLKKLSRHPAEGRRPPGVNARPQSGRPCQEKKIAVISGVVGMVMSDEDVAERAQRHFGECELARHAVAAINNVGNIVGDDHLRRWESALSRARAAARAEQDESRLGGRRRLCGDQPGLRNRER